MRIISLVSLILLGVPVLAQMEPGFTQVTSLPGRHVRLAVDESGSPALLFATADGALYFTNWQRASSSFADPLRIATGVTGGISLARCGGRWMASFVSDRTLKLVSSITEPRVQTVAPAESAVLACGPDGTIHLAFLQANVLRFSTGRSNAPAAQWKQSLVPPLANFDHFAGPMDLQVDVSGNPGLAFVLGGEGNSVGFWRPGRATARVIDTRGQEVDDPDVKLVFEDDRPRVLYHGKVDDLSYVEAGHDLWLAKSSDDGVNWESAFRIPSDGDRAMTPPISMAYGGSGRVAIVTESKSGTLEGAKCGTPKLARSADFQKFVTCGLAPLGKPHFSAANPTAVFGPGQSLYVAFQVTGPGELKSGVWIWREP